VAVPRRRGSRGSFQGKGVVAHRHVAAWMWSCRSSFRQAIVMAEVRTGRAVARGCRRRRSFAVVRVPNQRRSFLRRVAREASPGVRSSHRLRPGGAQRSWNDVRRCRAVLVAVPSSPWPPRRRTSIPRPPGSLSIRAQIRSKVLDSLLCDGGAAALRPGLVRRSPARDLLPVPCCLEASFRLNMKAPRSERKGFRDRRNQDAPTGILRPGGLGAGRRRAG
jgi:hypothetical protein